MKPIKTTFAGAILAFFVAVFFVSTAQAALLGSIIHTYGTTGNAYQTPLGDDINETNYVSIADPPSNGNNRFADTFNLSGLNYASIDYFTLTITFSNTNHGFTSLRENWNVRPGDSSTLLKINRIGGTAESQAFTIAGDVDTFTQMVTNQAFILWFAEQAIFRNSFKLYDAKLDVYGTAATPIPGAVWLLGSGLVGLVGLRRRNRN